VRPEGAGCIGSLSDIPLDKPEKTPLSARRAAVITPFFVDRDAVCNDVFHGAAALRRAGWDTRIFAVGGRASRERFHPAAELPAWIRDAGDLAYFHFSTGRRDLLETVAALPGRKLLKFHNITPPEMFSMWSDELAEASRAGRLEMPRVAALPWERVLGDSSFNLAEIERLLPPGAARGVLAPFHETDELLALRPAASPAGGMPRILSVGRIVQSKGHPFMLRVLRYLVHDLGVKAMLDVVGKPDHRMLAYMRSLALMVREFKLEAHVTFHGEIDSPALASLYASASAFLCTSEHEGFCVPLVEAMAFGVPIVALATTAVPETVGDAGVVWEARDPRVFALTLQRLLASDEERAWLAAQGRKRYAERFTNAAIGAQLAAMLGAD
jgi:glycosyltransferase involved in cell wall biosynthesis